MPINSGFGGQSDHQAAHLAGPCTIAGPVSPAVNSQTSPPNNAFSAITPSQSHLEGIMDILEYLPSETCFKLTRSLVTTASSFPTGIARQRAVLKSVIHFIAGYVFTA
jgi:hypothetical protein